MSTTIRSSCALIAASIFITTATSAAPGSDWPTFRGADRTAVSQETGLLTKWPSGGPPLLWQTRGAGRGYASLAIAGDGIFTLGDGPSTAKDKDEYLVCFDRKTGKRVWSTKTGKPWMAGQPTWRSSRSTPTVDGDFVYIITPFGQLYCLETANGHVKWQRSLIDDFRGRKGDAWGYSESVTIDGEHLICTPGGPRATMVALNKSTGDVVWTAKRPDDRGAAHPSIVIAEVGGTRVYVTDTASGPMGVRATDGKVLWTYPISQTPAVIPTPIVRGDLVFYSIGYKRGGLLLQQIRSADGNMSIKEIYPLNPKMANKHGGVVLVGNDVYGDTEDSGVPFCADMMTGEIKWKKRGSGRGSAAIAAADGHLYLHYASGTMVLALASPKGYTEVSSFKVPGGGDRPSWSHPVILDGKLYLREQDHVLCYDISKHGNGHVAGR